MPSRPKSPDVPLELWRRALDAVLAFRGLAPWGWMNDGEIAALVDARGQPWFASVLGAARQVFGLALYRGNAGLRVVKRLMAARGPEDWEELRFAQDGLTIWFGSKRELSPEERDRYATLGYRPARGARLAWPSILDHRPGWVAWPPDQDGVAWLLEALAPVCRLAEILRTYPGLYHGRGQFEFPLLSPKDLPAGPEDLEWRLWEVQPEPLPMRPVRIDDAEIAARLGHLPMGKDVSLDLDWFYSPEGVVEGGRPFYPKGIPILDTKSGTCLAMELGNATDDIAQQAADQLVKIMLQAGCVPRRVRVRRPELLAAMQPWLAGLGGSVKLVERLDNVEVFRQGLLQFMGRT